MKVYQWNVSIGPKESFINTSDRLRTRSYVVREAVNKEEAEQKALKRYLDEIAHDIKFWTTEVETI